MLKEAQETVKKVSYAAHKKEVFTSSFFITLLAEQVGQVAEKYIGEGRLGKDIEVDIRCRLPHQRRIVRLTNGVKDTFHCSNILCLCNADYSNSLITQYSLRIKDTNNWQMHILMIAQDMFKYRFKLSGLQLDFLSFLENIQKLSLK